MTFKGLNDNQVTVDCRLSQGLLYQARSGKSDLGHKSIEKILRKYQDLSRVFLLTGEGEMLKQPDERPTSPCIKVAQGAADVENIYNASHHVDRVPVIPANLYMQPNIDVLDYIKHDPTVRTSPVVKQFSDYDIYYIVYGGEMTPYFLPGDKLALSPYPQGKESSVIDGRAYVVDTRDNGLLLRQLYKKKNGFLARAYNDRYRDEFIERAQVTRVYRILGLIRSYT